MRGKVQLKLDDGSLVSSWIDLRSTERFSDPISTLDFTLAPLRQDIPTYRRKIRKGAGVTLFVDEKPQGRFVMEATRTTSGKNEGYSISVSCVSPIKVLYKATVDVPRATKLLQADTPVLDLVRDIVAAYNFAVYATDDVKVLKSKTGKNPKGSSTPAADAQFVGRATAQENEKVYAFINRILSRLGLILRMDSQGMGLVITAPHYTGDPLYCFYQGKFPQTEPFAEPFIGRVEETDSNDDQFSFCETEGLAPADLNATQSNIPKVRVLTTDINKNRPPFRADAPYDYKPLFYRDKACSSAAIAKNVSTCILGSRAESAYQITGTVDGVTDRGGCVYSVDAMARTLVERLELDEVLWISERTLRASKGDGRGTDLTLIPKGNYVIGDPAA